MQLTMAMGLRYEPGTGVSLLTDFNRGQESTTPRSENSIPDSIGQVIEIEAVEVRDGEVVRPARSRHFDYLVYDFQAGIVALPLIGSRLDTTV